MVSHPKRYPPPKPAKNTTHESPLYVEYILSPKSENKVTIKLKKIANSIPKKIEAKIKNEIPQGTHFYGQTRVDNINRDVVELAKIAGFHYISFGVETFSDESLGALDLRKDIKSKISFDSVKLCLENNIPITNINLQRYSHSAHCTPF